MLLVIFSFICFVGAIMAAYKVFKALKANDAPTANKWLIVTITFTLASWIVRGLYSLFQMTVSEESESKIKRKYYFLNEDYIFLDGITPKAYFKKGDVVSGFVIKYGEKQEDYLFTGVARIAIPIAKLRYPTETELTEIEKEVNNLMDNLKK